MQTTQQDEELERQVARSEQAAEALSPRTPTYVRHFDFWDPSTSRTSLPYDCVQAELGFLPAQRFFTKISREMKSFVDGKYGLKLGDLFGRALQARAQLPKTMDEESVNKVVADNSQMIEAFFKLVEVVPGFLEELIVLSLGVQDDHVEHFTKWINEPPHRGGLTQAEGFDILRAFIRQNAVGLRRFFEEEAKSLVDEFTLWVVNKGIVQAMKDGDPEAATTDSSETPAEESFSTSPVDQQPPTTSTPGGSASSTFSPVIPARS